MLYLTVDFLTAVAIAAIFFMKSLDKKARILLCLLAALFCIMMNIYGIIDYQPIPGTTAYLLRAIPCWLMGPAVCISMLLLFSFLFAGLDKRLFNLFVNLIGLRFSSSTFRCSAPLPQRASGLSCRVSLLSARLWGGINPAKKCRHGWEGCWDEKISFIAAVVFPIVVLFGVMISKQLRLAQGSQIILPIEGFDPRDLLSALSDLPHQLRCISRLLPGAGRRAETVCLSFGRIRP